MPTLITTQKANEKGTFKITAAFADETDASMTPNTGLNWTLTDDAGNVINSRSAVTITPASSVDIILSGNDLAIGNNGTKRILTIQGTYDSSAGSNLPLKDEIVFYIHDLLAVS